MTVLDALDLAGCDDRELGRRAQAGDARARRALIERYLPFARRLALRYRQSAEPLDDVTQVASIGLIKAVDRWEPSMGHAFISYAMPTILGELRRYFRDATWMVRPPRGLLELARIVEHARDPLGAALGREPSVADLAEFLDRPAAAVAEAHQAYASRLTRSLDIPVDDSDREPSTVGELVGREDDEYVRVEARTVVERLTRILDQRAREILRLRFEHDLLQSEIAAAVGCSQMQVSRIIRVSLERMSAHASTLEAVLERA
jgi:RNA polymerase sigma-B factor